MSIHFGGAHVRQIAFGIVSLALAAGAACGQQFELLYDSVYQQTGPNPPTVTLQNSASAFVIGDTLGIVQPTVTSPYQTLFELSGENGNYQTFLGSHPTQGGLLSEVPAGDWLFSWIDAEENSYSTTLVQPFPLGLWPNQIPAFTPETLNALQSMNPSLPREVVVNQFVPVAQASDWAGGLFVNVNNGGLYGELVFAEIGGGEFGLLTARTIPANALQPETNYVVTWIFSQYAQTPDYSGPGIANTQFRVTTQAFFTTGIGTPTCDSIDFNGDALFPDDQDLIEFLSVLAGGECSSGTCNDIDFNNDGLFPDDSDLITFLAVLAGGAC